MRLTLAPCFFVVLTVVASAGSARAASAADYFTRMQTYPPGLLIQHCAVEAPETRAELAAEYETFKDRFAQAAAPLLAKMPAAVAPELAPELERFITELGQRQLQAVKQLEPHAYCTWLLKSLRASTTETLRATMQAAFDRYTEMATSKSTPPDKR